MFFYFKRSNWTTTHSIRIHWWLIVRFMRVLYVCLKCLILISFGSIFNFKIIQKKKWNPIWFDCSEKTHTHTSIDSKDLFWLLIYRHERNHSRSFFQIDIQKSLINVFVELANFFFVFFFDFKWICCFRHVRLC